MIKDRVLKPLIVATEKVVEYYLNEEDKEKQIKQQDPLLSNSESTQPQVNPLQGQVNFDLNRKFERLLISEEDEMDMTFSDSNNPKSQSMVQSSQSSRGLGKKRTFRELERWDIDFSQTTGRQRIQSNNFSEKEFDQISSSRRTERRGSRMIKDESLKTLRFNSGLLQKASAAVDLISQKIEFKNLMNQSITGSFVTVILELTHDFIDKLEKQEQHIIKEQVSIATSATGKSPENLNIKFIKPSPHFYNKIMSLWFKFNHLQNSRNQDICMV